MAAYILLQLYNTICGYVYLITDRGYLDNIVIHNPWAYNVNYEHVIMYNLWNRSQII